MLLLTNCSNEETNSTENTNEKKLTQVVETNNYGVYELNYIYDSSNNIIELEGSFSEFGEPTPDLHNIVFTNENGLTVSAIEYEDGTLYKNHVFNYSNNQLVEKISYTSSGIEDEKFEYSYNSNGKMASFNYYVESDLQQTQNYTYDTAGNIPTADDSHDFSEIQYDIYPTPSHNFSPAEKLIFGPENMHANLSENNVTYETTTYNYNTSSDLIYQYETTITYDSDNYPISKTLIQTDNNNNQSTIRTVTFEYE